MEKVPQDLTSDETTAKVRIIVPHLDVAISWLVVLEVLPPELTYVIQMFKHLIDDFFGGGSLVGLCVENHSLSPKLCEMSEFVVVVRRIAGDGPKGIAVAVLVPRTCASWEAFPHWWAVARRQLLRPVLGRQEAVASLQQEVGEVEDRLLSTSREVSLPKSVQNGIASKEADGRQ